MTSSASINSFGGHRAKSTHHTVAVWATIGARCGLLQIEGGKIRRKDTRCKRMEDTSWMDRHLLSELDMGDASL